MPVLWLLLKATDAMAAPVMERSALASATVT